MNTKISEDDREPQTNKNIILIVVITLATNATIGVCTLAWCIVSKTEPNLAVFTAFTAIVNYILGVISGMLIKSSPTQSATQPTGTVTVPEQKLDTTTQ